jgi:hypothetical protein
MSERTRVLFVGGYGRSGSTVIDVLLDRVPEVTAVGEFRHLFGRALGDNELCSCGEPFAACITWRTIIERAYPAGFDRERIQAAVRAINRVVAYGPLRRQMLMTPQMREHARIYREAFAAAYRSVAEVTGASVIVDSSKYPLHGMLVAGIPSVELAVMLLVRDPRAVAYSWTREKVRPEVHWERRMMPRHNVVRSALAWNASNHLTSLIDVPRERFRVQRYEDFVADPAGQLAAIASFAMDRPTRVDHSVFESARRVPHTVAGNPVRIGSEHVRVASDDAWRTEMSRGAQVAVTACCLPLLGRYGYGHGSSPTPTRAVSSG